MKWLLLISISFLLIGISCQEQLSPPTEQEVKKALTDWNEIKLGMGQYSEGPFLPGLPSEIKRINVIEVKKGGGKLFSAKIFVKAMNNQYVIPRREFIDTIEVELKKIEKRWVIENMKHQFNYSGNYNPADSRF